MAPRYMRITKRELPQEESEAVTDDSDSAIGSVGVCFISLYVGILPLRYADCKPAAGLFDNIISRRIDLATEGAWARVHGVHGS